MMEEDRGARYEPQPRWGHVSVTRDGKVYVWGGRTEDFSEAKQKKLASTLEVFDCRSEIWTQHTTRGIPPKGLYNAAYALQGSILYVYGGWDGQKAHNSLFQLNLQTFEWSEVKFENPEDAPTEISGCGLVACGNHKLVLFGGYGMIKEKKKKMKKVKKAQVDPRYALVSVADDNLVAEEEKKIKEQSEQTEEREGKKNKDKEVAGVEAKNDNEKEEQEGTAEMEKEDKATEKREGEIVNEEEVKKEKQERGEGPEEGDGGKGNEEVVKENDSLVNSETPTDSGVVEPVRVRDQTQNSGEENEVKDGARGAEKTEEEKEKTQEEEVEKENIEESNETPLVIQNEVSERDGKSDDSTVQQIDVVNEHMNIKSRKAVVIKLPVSFELEGETGSDSVFVAPGSSKEDVRLENDKTSPKEMEVKEKDMVVENGEEEEVQPKVVVEEEEEEEEKEEEKENTTFSVYKRSEEDPKGWTNEIKVFDLDTRMWTSQPTSGTLPPPCVDFSFTSPDKKKAVVFGGFQPPTGITFDTFILDMETWVWTKISGQSPTPASPPSRRTPSILSHPSARDGHSSCVVAGAPHPMILMSGGWDASDQAVSDLWLLDVNSGLWKQISGGKDMACRFWHTIVMSQTSSRLRQLLIFGGCPGAPESHKTGSWPKMADTILLELGNMPGMHGNFVESLVEEKWMVVDIVTMEELGDPLRRLKEVVLLTSYRVQRAENLLKSVAKKISTLGIATPQTPQRKAKSPRVKTPVTPEKAMKKAMEKAMEKKEVEEVKKPFWQKSTDEIQMTYEELGRGRFSVVKVAIFHETKVAARCLFNRIPPGEHLKVFNDCLELASQLRHPNLVSFIGAILDLEPIIITELMACNLRSQLEKSALTYYQVMDVAEGVSKALQYLHSVKPEPVIHGELTSTSVLLEDSRGPRLRAKLSDYTTAKYFHHLMTSHTSVSSPDHGISYSSREHHSQEYKARIARRSSSPCSPSPFDITGSGKTQVVQFKKSTTAPPDATDFSTKRDVYLFGILLVEMATRTAVLEVSLHYLVKSIAWSNVATLATKCVSQDQSTRPDMSEVVSQVMLLASSKP